jgi:hypothetical protein
MWGPNWQTSLLICDPKRTESFRHRERRTNLAIQQWNQPLPLLPGVAIAGQNLWIEEVDREA